MGYKASVLVDGIDSLADAQLLTYGRGGAVDPRGSVQFLIGGEQLGNALAKSEGLVVCSDGKDLSATVTAAVKAGGKRLKRATLLSAPGGSKGGGGAAKTEAALKAACEDAGVEWAIVRAGPLLKGGGPGNIERGDNVGLDRYFYDTNPELNSFQKDKFADQYLLAAKLMPGDTVALNPLEFFAAANSISSVSDGVCNRATAAAALLQSLKQPACGGADFTVASVRGLAEPTQASWDQAVGECVGRRQEAVTGYAPGDLPKATLTAAQKARKAVMEARGLSSSEVEGGVAKGYKLGASSREEELERKQLIGHVIPFGFIAVPLLSGNNLGEIAKLFAGVGTADLFSS